MESLKSQLEFIHEMEAKEILEEAKEKAQGIVKEAEEKAEEIKKQKMAQASKKLDEKEQLDLATVKLNSKSKILNTKFHFFEEAMAKSEIELKKIVTKDTGKYSESLRKLIIEATMNLGSNEFEIVANPRDRESVVKSLKQLERKISSLKGENVKLKVAEETTTALGGVVVRTFDKKQIFNNTLETRMTKFRNEAGQKVFDMLFEGVRD